jgi:hypothetical protein
MPNWCRCPRCDRHHTRSDVSGISQVHRLGFGWAVPCRACLEKARKLSQEALKDFWKPQAQGAGEGTA